MPQAEAAPPERTLYQAGAGRKTVLSLAFLLLLPFYASLPVMLFQRLVHGLWLDMAGLLLFAVAFTIIMGLLGVQLYQALRSRVELGATSVKLTLPQGTGATPMLRFLDREVPYDQIDAVETRCVLFGGTLAPVMLRSTRLLTKSGERVRLGHVNEDNVDQALPFPEMGAKIAARAGVPVIDAGIVHRPIQRPLMRFLGHASPPDENRAVTETEIAELKARHTRAMRRLVAALAVLVVVGVAIDILTAPRTSFATAGASPAGRGR